MSAKTDFHLTVDRAANAVVDALCASRAAVKRPIPDAQRGRMRRAIGQLDAALDALYLAQQEPWQPPQVSPQLELL